MGGWRSPRGCGARGRGGLRQPTAAAVALMLVTAAGVGVLAPAPADAAVATVSTLDDTDGPCEPDDCSLRAAINAGTAVIDFAPGLTGDIDLFEELPHLSHDVEIRGPGADALTVRRQQGPDFRIFTVSGGATVEISGLTVWNGRASPGGGILNGSGVQASTLTLRDVVVRGNTGGWGGGIASYGTLTVENSTVRDNVATTVEGGGGILAAGGRLTVRDSAVTANQAQEAFHGGGIRVNPGVDATIEVSSVSDNTQGGIHNVGGEVTITESTVRGNSVVRGNVAPVGGGIRNGDEGTLTLERSTVSANEGCGNIYLSGGGIAANSGAVHVTNSTVSGNTGCSRGGGIVLWGTAALTLENSTVAANRAGSGGANLHVEDAETEAIVVSTILANPLGEGPNCAVEQEGTITSGGHNLDDDGSCAFGAPGDQPVADAQLAPLGDYGGPTATMALGEGSPAIDKALANGLATDQRGRPRPVEFTDRANAPGGDGSDIGAFELGDPTAAARDTTRVAGPDRFATAAALSAGRFDAGAPVAYVATGLAFADALTGAVAAALDGGPVLLAATDTVPEATAAELGRLEPGRIVLLGGTAALSERVEAELEAFTDGGVQRVAGADRFATAAEVSQALFPTGADTAYVGTGLNFPDVLAGGPAAAGAPGPILLVTSDTVPQATATELARLDLERVVILGGESAVGRSVAAELADYGEVERSAGRDRFATAAALSAATFADADTVERVYVATGLAFADALAAGAVAGGEAVPVLLVATHQIPEATAAELARLDPDEVMVMGGEAAISRTVEAQLSQRGDSD